MQTIKISESAGNYKRIFFTAVDPADGTTRVTGLSSFTVYISIGGASPTSGAGAVSEVNASNMPGVYRYTPDTSEINAAGVYVLTVAASGMETREIAFQVVNQNVMDLADTGDVVTITDQLDDIEGKVDTIDGLVDGLVAAMTTLPEDTKDEILSHVLDAAYPGTVIGALRRIVALATGEASGLISTTATFRLQDGTTAWTADQDPGNGDRDPAAVDPDLDAYP